MSKADELPARGRLPKPGCFVSRSGEDTLPIRAEGRHKDGTIVTKRQMFSRGSVGAIELPLSLRHDGARDACRRVRKLPMQAAPRSLCDGS